MSDDDEPNWQQEPDFLQAKDISEQQGSYSSPGAASCSSASSEGYSWYRLQDKTEIVSHFHPCPQCLD